MHREGENEELAVRKLWNRGQIGVVFDNYDVFKVLWSD
jgi:hypothetical protein